MAENGWIWPGQELIPFRQGTTGPDLIKFEPCGSNFMPGFPLSEEIPTQDFA